MHVLTEQVLLKCCSREAHTSSSRFSLIVDSLMIVSTNVAVKSLCRVFSCKPVRWMSAPDRKLEECRMHTLVDAITIWLSADEPSLKTLDVTEISE